MMIDTALLARESRAGARPEQIDPYTLHSNLDLPRRKTAPGFVEIQGAIDAAKFTVHYQPQIDISTGAIHAVEALIRCGARRGMATLVAARLRYCPGLFHCRADGR